MVHAAKRLLPGVGLIVLAALVLLVADRCQQAGPEAEKTRIAIFQWASRPVLDDCVAGAVAGLKAQGLEEGRALNIRYYNAENDMATANSMAQAILEGGNRMVVTVSTNCLQVMANVNQAGKMLHVFGAVTDPFAAGVGISRRGRPAHLAGLGTFQPVRETFQLAKGINPALKRVGVVWNPADAAAEACLALARDESRRLGITLLEAQVETSAAVAEAATSLTARGAQALWVGGDNTVEVAVASLVQAARRAGIPLFCNAPTHLEAGAFFALGADYWEVGRLTGDLAGRVLRGVDPATVPVENIVPQRLAVNLAALAGLRERWLPGREIIDGAAILIDGQGRRVRWPGKAGGTDAAPGSVTPPRPSPQSLPMGATPASPAAWSRTAEQSPAAAAKVWRIGLLDYTDSVNVEETHRGLFAEFKALGLAEGRHFTLSRHSAHGDMAILSGIFDAALNARPDLIVTTSTPTLQVAVNKVKQLPVVFTVVADGVQAGAGESETRHRANITGVTTMSDFDGMVRLVREHFPAVRRIGTLFVPGEVNSVRYKEELARAAARGGLGLEAVGVATTAEVSDATLSLAGKGVEIITQISDNLTGSAVPAIAEAARKVGVPLFGFVSGTVKGGAAVVVARDYEEGGRLGARLVARIMKGESPAAIPFTPLAGNRIVVSPKNAERYGMKIPPALLQKADSVVN